ncbi:MAG: iron uptake porin, partial [Synechococcus sp.]
SNLIERFGCVAGYPNGTYKGGQAMTRYEAAALLNACLDRITEVTDELKRLMKEFEQELAVLKGRVDGLEAKVGELEATQFSTTTKLAGDTVFVIGANSFGGSEDLGTRTPDQNAENWGATVFNYDVRLNFSTSFTGKDLLYTRLRSGNFNSSPFAGRPFNLMALDRAFSPSGGPNQVEIDRLYYRFPIGSDFTALVGGRARNTEFLAIRPSFYGGRGTNILDVFTLHGAPGTYNKATGAAFGLMWKQNVKKGNPYFAASTSYIAPSGNEGDPSVGGLFTDASKGSFTTQIGVAAPQWALAFAWRYGQCGQNFRRGTQFANQNQPCPASGSDDSAYSNNFAVTAAWQPVDSGWVPSISTGWGYNALTQAGDSAGFDAANNIEASQSWYVGLEWSDVFAKGNAFGMAVGQPVFATSLRDGDTPRDGNYVWEWWYKFQVTDNISITPAIFYLSRPDGQFTTAGETNNVFGGLVQTQFKF